MAGKYFNQLIGTLCFVYWKQGGSIVVEILAIELPFIAMTPAFEEDPGEDDPSCRCWPMDRDDWSKGEVDWINVDQISAIGFFSEKSSE